MSKVKGVSEAELAQLSDAEREALETGEEDDAAVAESLRKIAAKGDAAGPGDQDDDDDDDDNADPEKAAAKLAAQEKAEAKAAAKAEAEAAEKAKADGKVEEARRAALTEEARAKEDAEKVKAEAKAKADAEVKAKAEAAAAAAAADDDGDDLEAEILRPRLPRYKVEPVEKYEEKVKAIDDAIAAAEAKYAEGDLELKDLLSTTRKLTADRYDLTRQQDRAQMAEEHNTQAVRTEWLGDVQDFFVKTNAAEGIDYTKRGLNVAFDDALKTLAADKANAERSTAWYLREAHKMVKADLGLTGKVQTAEEKAAAEAAAKAAALKKAKAEGREPKLAAVPALGAAPSAGDDDASGGNPEFRAIDALEGIEFEDALAALPKAKHDAYLRSRG